MGHPAPYPGMIVPAGHVEPVPRRIRAYLGGRLVLDTRRAHYVWEWPPYPQYSIPAEDIVGGELADEGYEERRAPGPVRRHALRVGDQERPGAAWVWGADAATGLPGTVRFEWDAFDAWFEEDEQVFGHPRDPYHRCDARRSSDRVTVRVGGTVVAETDKPVKLFETSLAPRWYVPVDAVRPEALTRSETTTVCPYKGVASYYTVAGVADAAWVYEEPFGDLTAIAGLLSFAGDGVEVVVEPSV
jgi:uncharacterized protein (DUF427 family)